MYFHIISDIHLEFSHYSLKSHVNKTNRKEIDEKEEINLILAGDIGYPEQKVFENFIESTVKLYDHIFMVIGNHEYYKKGMDETKMILKNIVDKYPTFHLLDNELYLHNDVYLVGSTLWSYVDENDSGRKTPINDYYSIKDFTIDKSNELYKINKDFLAESLAAVKSQNKKCIIITHHLPSYQLIDKSYKSCSINSFFASNCEDLMQSFNDTILLWVYGHTHTAANHRIFNIEFICNPKGYPSEYSKYSKTISYKI